MINIQVSPTQRFSAEPKRELNLIKGTPIFNENTNFLELNQEIPVSDNNAKSINIDYETMKRYPN